MECSGPKFALLTIHRSSWKLIGLNTLAAQHVIQCKVRTFISLKTRNTDVFTSTLYHAQSTTFVLNATFLLHQLKYNGESPFLNIMLEDSLEHISQVVDYENCIIVGLLNGFLIGKTIPMLCCQLVLPLCNLFFSLDHFSRKKEIV